MMNLIRVVAFLVLSSSFIVTTLFSYPYANEDLSASIRSSILQGRYEEAQSLCECYLESIKSSTPLDFLKLAEAKELLGTCLFFQERYAEAEELVREALEIFEVEGANRVQIREALSFLTSILERQGKSKEANDLHMARRNPGDKVAKVSESPTPKPPEGEPAIPQDIAPSFDKPDKSIGDNRKKRDFERKYDQLTNVISRFQTMLVESRNCDLAIKSNQPDMARICKTFEDRVKIEWDRNANVVKDLSKDKDFYIEYSSHFVLADQLMSDITEQLRYNTNYKYYLLRKYLK
mgnify:CR=1 FL=1